MPHDFYRILGVDPDADEKGIKKAYRNIIKYCHPDSPDCRMTTEELLEVQEAYQTLIDPEKRARYDRKRSASGAAHITPKRRGTTVSRVRPRPSLAPDEVFRDLFSLFDDPFGASPIYDFFGRGRSASRSLEIILTPLEASRGGLFEITVPGPGGIPAGSIMVRIPPNVQSGTVARIDLSETAGIRGFLSITVLVENERGR